MEAPSSAKTIDGWLPKSGTPGLVRNDKCGKPQCQKMVKRADPLTCPGCDALVFAARFFPLPLAGEGQGWGQPRTPAPAAPPPIPPPQAGEGGKASARHAQAPLVLRRPGERRDPYAVPLVLRDAVSAFAKICGRFDDFRTKHKPVVMGPGVRRDDDVAGKPGHTSAFSPRVFARAVQECFALRKTEGAGNAGRAMRPQPRMRNKINMRA